MIPGILGMSSDQIAALTTAQIQAMDSSDFRTLGSEQIAALQIYNSRGLLPAQITALTTAQVKALTSEGPV